MRVRGAGRARALSAVGVLLSVTGAGAQTIWVGPERPEGLQLELHHPELDDFESGVLTSVAFLGGRLRASPTTNLVADLPLAYADNTASTDFAVGAPYFGLERLTSSTILEVGLRIPIASNNFGSAVGSATELVDRFGAFDSSTLVVNATGTLGGTSDAGLTHRIRGGPRVLVGTSGGAEVAADYGGLVGYAAPKWGIEAGLTGLVLLTVDATIGERTFHQAGVQVYRALRSGGRLGFLFRLPLDHDTSTTLDYTIGVVATIATPRT